MARRQRDCRGHGLQEKNYNVVIELKPWPWILRLRTYTSIFCRLGQFLTTISARSLACFVLLLCLASIPLLILLSVLNTYGARAPRTELQALTIHNFNLTRDGASGITPWLANGNCRVVFQARNPSWVVGLRHRYLSTRVSAFYQYKLLGQAEVPRFSVGHKSARHVSASVVIREVRIDQLVGLSLQNDMQKWGSVWLSVAVDAFVEQKRMAGADDPKWLKLSCLVNVSMMNSTDEAGNLLSKTCPWG